jgi:NAD-dependent SIR2 family protein deacetylase
MDATRERRTRAGTVVFLGAGASKAFGLPLTGEIMPRMVGRLHLHSKSQIPLFKGPERQRLVREFEQALKTLYPGLGLDPTAKELPNITNVLSLVDHLIIYESPAGRAFGKEPMTRARRLLERALMEVLLNHDLSGVMEELEEYQQYHPAIKKIVLDYTRPMTRRQNENLETFHTWIEAKRKRGPVTIITTNYDVSVEALIVKSRQFVPLPSAIDFGFDWRDAYISRLHPRPLRPKLAYFKLHGSLNWLRCDLCGQVYVNPHEAIAYMSFSARQCWANTCACGWWPLRHLIVAPSTVRDIRDAHLLNIWRSATEALRTAREWFIIGYSLPAEDLAIRSMFLRAFAARGMKSGSDPIGERPSLPGPDVTVVQQGGGSRATYAAMFREFRYLGGGLRRFLNGELPKRAR